MSQAISSQITSIGELLRASGKLVVPPFQRNYAWGESNYADLWLDIQETLNGNTDEYFLGSVVIDNSTAPDLTLIDGQQRVTTTTILICALRWHLLFNNLNELSDLVSQDFLTRPDYDNQSLTSNLVLNLNDRDFFEQYILRSEDPERLGDVTDEESHSPSNLHLARCYIYMCKQIGQLIRKKQSLETVAHDIITALREKILLIRIDVADDVKAFTLFEVLNTRGVELSEADLLKNAIFSKAGQHLDELRLNWEIMGENIGHKPLMRFMQHHWISNHGNLPRQGLFPAIKKRVVTPHDALQFSERITTSSEYYGAMIEPSHDLWLHLENDHLDEIKRLLTSLNLMRTEQCYIPLLAALEICPTSFHKHLRMIRDFTFRYTTILGKSSSDATKAYMRAAHSLREDGPAPAEVIFDRFFSDLYPQDNEFHSAFSKKTIKIFALARHILAEIENNLTGPDGPQYSATDLNINLEHILPRKYKSYWPNCDADFQGGPHKYLNRLGNLTLLGRELNSDIGNTNFDNKKQLYASDCLEITKRMLEEPRWTADAISRRQNWLASEAVKIWRCTTD
ncbi:MAG: hypothetical protein DHS20C08_22400 [Rhodomicrobium sp.]|nr:MAG: hypothetical protein DHS20C08_22400 [Rhodomicrobium sp.]